MANVWQTQARQPGETGTFLSPHTEDIPMKAKTSTGSKLKRLAKKYASAWAEMTWMGNRHPDEHNEIRQTYEKAQKTLHDAIDEATSIDLAPRAVQEST